MWTPRRICLLVIGVVLCSGAYTVYAHYLGWVNGLPPLPPRYREVSRNPIEPPPFDPAEQSNPLTKRIQEAFGFNCDELHYYKIDNRSKGVLLLFGDHVIDADGRVQLTPCSVAIFGKRGASGVQEISAIHCDRAFIQFDKPVKKYGDMDGRKIVAAELRSDPELRSNDPRKGHIHLRNNRRSADPADAVTMRTVGPIFYKDAPVANAPHVFTDSVIEITDHQNLPRLAEGQQQPLLPPTVTATGMKLFLAVAEDPKASDPKKTPAPKIDAKKVGPLRAEKKPSPGSISGVERVELNQGVTMNLWVEPGTGFPGNAPKAKPAAPRPGGKPPEKSLIQIHADGPFRYDIETDVARFDHAPQSDPSIPNYVQVIRHTPEGRDMLSCDHLEIQFTRKKPSKGPAAKGATVPAPVPPQTGGRPENDMDIETVHSWGKTIVLSSDGEDLTAWANDLVHDATRKQTVLKGEPLIALKEGNQIRAREMILVGTDDRMSQQARVKGPGQIDLNQIDPVTRKPAFTRQAVWQDWLVFTRVKEQGRDLDILTLTGGARFADLTNDQSLSARQLKVWLLPKEQKPDPKAPPIKGKAAASAQQARPHRLEATGQVVAHSVELDVQNADYLNIWFRELPPRPLPPAPKGSEPLLPKPVEPGPKAKVELPAPKQKEEPKKAKPPIRINARRIETWVRVIDGKNELERAHCEEQVAVHQDPSEQSEKGVDIAGHTVDVEHHPDGSILTVTGHPDKTSGEVHFDKLSLIGDDIVVDQRNNAALVKKAGSMRMLTSSSLQGEKLAKPTAVTIHWKDAMEFRGSERWARFEGGVQAEQNTARVLCETMQVTLDREVWLNQAQRPKDKSKDAKEDRSPRVERVVMDQMPRDEVAGPKKQPQPVNYTDEVRNGEKIIRFQAIDARELNLDNLKSDVVAPGPGEVRVFQLGSKDPLGDPAPGGKKGAKPDPKKPGVEQEMKLTVVKYLGRMKANNKTRTAVFYDTIDVVHLPAKGPDEKYDVNKPGPGMMRLRCDTSLEVFTKRSIGPDGKERNSQNLTARGNVRVESEEFSGTAESVKYDEEKETVIFEGSRENPAVLYRVVGQGLPPERSAAVKIIYNKRTRSFEMDRGVGVQTN